ncbi:MAG: terminase large subunit, partial [Ruminococcus sp.]|nr:terminase large subunit [Candidatus Copronaster equi]
KLDFDEYHAYENYDLIELPQSGLVKVPFPRKGISTTDGRVRQGPLDNIKARSEDILFKGANDLGLLPFICRLPDIELVHDKMNWHMANPSLQYFPNLMAEMEKEYAEWMLDPSPTHDFIVKRMNIPPTELENDITSWENILATNREMPDLTGCECVPAIDYAKTTDFVSAGCLFKHSGIYYWITHTWVCSKSADLHRIKAPLDEWAEAGLLTFVDAPEINPEIPVDWIMKQLEKYSAKVFSIDSFRFTLLAKALKKAGFEFSSKKKNILLTKRVTVMRWAPVIKSSFANQQIVWGNNPLMRWFTNNACEVMDSKGNITFEKKEAKSRKTDGFMALVSAFCASENLKDSGEDYVSGQIQVYTY